MVAKGKRAWKPTWRDVKERPDTGETTVTLQARLDKSKRTRGGTGTHMLDPQTIYAAINVFQWRLLKQNVLERQGHIITMAQALLDNGRAFDPILVFPVGKRFYVMDGHNRLAAYATVGWKDKIPAVMFEGTLDEGATEALKLNIKDKLRMTKDEKQEAAWRMVKQGGGKGRKQISEDTTVSTSNISNMKKTIEKLEAKGEDPHSYTWVKARMWMTGVEFDDKAEDWKEREADKIVEALRRSQIGPSLTKNPDITLLAWQLDGETATGAVEFVDCGPRAGRGGGNHGGDGHGARLLGQLRGCTITAVQIVQGHRGARAI